MNVLLAAVSSFLVFTTALGAPIVLAEPTSPATNPPSATQPQPPAQPSPGPTPGQPAVPQPSPSQPPVTQPSPGQPSSPPLTPGQPAVTQPSPARPAVTGQRQKIEGVVQSVEGSTMRVKSDTGPVIVVDLSQVSEKVHQIVAQGEVVTVIGVRPPGSSRLTAQAVIGHGKAESGGVALPRDVQKPSRPSPPAPASKEGCKNGGWARYGFKNQGQCVSAVERSR